ncbi:hypothetical protein [Streptomyces sp. AK02-01A]|uniref:hypothetical protein n=1 Tax=Streptomyces sp. AK02-01A TaxID=3028648 RepID=UPI0029B9C856|nr:hypothetical protein [Streptomyces sp. AK02-01A]MDX3849531.1 hypothetical protein [Streptomyces sp. AK02-01A]MDX3849899.1 hypothetical protein [Streptomyces sp. AK02-01A]
MPQTEDGRLFRETWIAGVRAHFPGEPKPGYVTPWEDTPEWERQAAAAVQGQVRQFLLVSEGHASRLSREQKGWFVATCWTAQMFKHFEAPKPGYVADWPDLPDWQKETDSDIFEAVEKSIE